MLVSFSLIFNIVFSLFIVMIIGIITRVSGIIDWKVTKRLSSLLVNITQPLLLLMAFQTDFNASKMKAVFTILSASIIMLFAFTFIAKFINRGTVKKDRSITNFCLVFSNCAFIGYPVLQAIFPVDGLFFGAVFTIFFNIYIRVYAAFFLNPAKKPDSKTIREAFINPGNIGTVLGVLLFVFSIKIPGVLATSFLYVGNMTFPLSMIIIGSLLCNQPFIKMFKPDMFLFSFIKLIILPLATLAFCLLVKLGPNLTYICVSMAALPTAASSAIFADYYNCDGSLAARCVGLTSVLSFLTVPAMLYAASWIMKTLGRI